MSPCASAASAGRNGRPGEEGASDRRHHWLAHSLRLVVAGLSAALVIATALCLFGALAAGEEGDPNASRTSQGPTPGTAGLAEQGANHPISGLAGGATTSGPNGPFETRVAGCRKSVQTLAQAWRYQEPWSQRSINFSLSGEPKVLGLSPVSLSALWAALAAAGYWALCWRAGVPARWSAVAGLVLLAWLALDLRWQGQLWARLADSQARYAHLSQPERPEGAPDGDLYAAVSGLRAHLPQTPARILLFTATPGGYLSARTRYHLLPHRVYVGPPRPLTPDQVAPGDYLFIMVSVRSASYDAARQRLTLEGAPLPATPIHSIPKLGTLFQVRETG